MACRVPEHWRSFIVLNRTKFTPTALIILALFFVREKLGLQEKTVQRRVGVPSVGAPHAARSSPRAGALAPEYPTPRRSSRLI